MTTAPVQIAEEDRLRAHLYDFLARLLAEPPDAALLAQAAALEGDENTEIGRAINALAREAGRATPEVAEREFSDLFIGITRGELLPYASFYLTGFLNERPLAQLRRDMGLMRIDRAPNRFEPEDNIASLLEMMAGMILGRFAAPVPVERQVTFFNRHVGPWAGHFFADLQAAESARFYAPVGAVGAAFVEIEREAFRMSAA